uniref:Envelope fusion protein n=1 Tax=Schizaphis graminum TaxID=13262 RepID=A0A2S2PUH4_SCHGA
MIISGPRENEAEHSIGLFSNIYNITTFPDNQGLYFEHHGPVRMSHFNWDLIAYVDLAEPGYKYQAIMSQYEATAKICEQMTQRVGNAELSNACEQFVQLFARATLPYLYEIENRHRNMLLSIGDEYTETTRVRRGFARTVKQMANVLYGIYSNIDTEFIFNQIVALSQSRSQNITLNSERMRIVQVKTDNQMKKITQHQEKLEENLQYLKKQTEVMIQKLDRIEFKTRLLEQALLFEILLNQYSYHTQNLMAIINSAMNGKLHTSMFTSERLLMELREIKVNLPMGTALPLEIETESLPEFLRISDLTIMHREHYLIFLIGIPLTSIEEYTMYHPIPLPIQYDINSIALITPEVDYLALSNDNENFVSLGESQWESCAKLGSYTLCKGDQPTHYRSGSKLCELSQLTNFQSPLKDCEVKLVALDTPIWHRLSKANSWLYYTKAEYCTITCTDPPQTSRVEISGMGRLTILPSCEIHTESFILSSSFKTNRDVKLDVIPENQKFDIKSTILETLGTVIPQNLSNVKIFKDFNFLAHKAIESSKLEHRTIEPLFIFKVEFHITILYLSLTISILIVCAIVIRCRDKIVKMYSPEIADNDSNKDQDDP